MLTLKELIEEVRTNIGDETHTYPIKTIIGWINFALREFSGYPNAFSLFVSEDSLELADKDSNGKDALSWRLDNDEVGSIISMRSLRLINSDPCVECDVPIRYANDALFNSGLVKDCSRCENICQCIDKANITLFKSFEGTFLKTDTAFPSGTIALITYEFSPRRFSVEDLNKVVPVNNIMLNLLLRFIRVQYHLYNVDDARAKAEYEDIDKDFHELKQQLAKDNSDFILKRSV